MQFIVTSELDGKQRTVEIDLGKLTPTDRSGVYMATIEGRQVPVFVRTDGIDTVSISLRGYEYAGKVLKTHHAELFTMLASSPAARSRSVRVSAPMPGLLKAILTAEGAVVRKGDTLFTLEAMKMENAIASPISGTVHSLNGEPGKAMEKGALLCIVDPA